MNVLVVTNMWPTADEPSFGCFVAEQVEDLRGLGLHVDVIAFAGIMSEQRKRFGTPSGISPFRSCTPITA